MGIDIVSGSTEPGGTEPGSTGPDDHDEDATPWSRRAGARVDRSLGWLDMLGDQLIFYVSAVAWTPRAVRRYTREVLRLLAEVSFGSGALGLIGGTVGVMIGMTLFTGTVVGLQGYAALNQIGASAFTGFVSAYFNTREIAPLVAGLALSATVGAGFTAQLGSMRINEEVDALEMMAVPPIPYLVSTRVIAALVAVVPLYLVGLFAAYVGTEFTISVFFQQSAGTYAHYFHVFIQPSDVIYSVVKVVVFALLIIPVQSYYGFYASGGPEGVGRAAGRGIRSASVMIAVADMLMTFLFWGTSQTVGLSA